MFVSDFSRKITQGNSETSNKEKANKEVIDARFKPPVIDLTCIKEESPSKKVVELDSSPEDSDSEDDIIITDTNAEGYLRMSQLFNKLKHLLPKYSKRYLFT